MKRCNKAENPAGLFLCYSFFYTTSTHSMVKIYNNSSNTELTETHSKTPFHFPQKYIFSPTHWSINDFCLRNSCCLSVWFQFHLPSIPSLHQLKYLEHTVKIFVRKTIDSLEQIFSDLSFSSTRLARFN